MSSTHLFFDNVFDETHPELIDLQESFYKINLIKFGNDLQLEGFWGQKSYLLIFSKHEFFDMPCFY